MVALGMAGAGRRRPQGFSRQEGQPKAGAGGPKPSHAALEKKPPPTPGRAALPASAGALTAENSETHGRRSTSSRTPRPPPDAAGARLAFGLPSREKNSRPERKAASGLCIFAPCREGHGPAVDFLYRGVSATTGEGAADEPRRAALPGPPAAATDGIEAYRSAQRFAVRHAVSGGADDGTARHRVLLLRRDFHFLFGGAADFRAFGRAKALSQHSLG